MKSTTRFKKLQSGDKVAILSPSNGLPELFPWVQDLGLERLHSIFDLEPIEYPTTRRMGSSLEDRATDIMSAFSNPDIKAIFASIGGNDQIQLIKLLDKDIIKKNPKPFFGFSDNTHLHILLSSLGIPSFYGGSIMTQFAMHNAMLPETIDSLRAALFTHEPLTFTGSENYNEIGIDWANKDLLHTERQFEQNEGLIWDGGKKVSGWLFGGCMESFVAQSASEIYLPDTADMSEAVLFLESAENIPPHWLIRYLMIGLGERGWLSQISGLMIGRPKAWDFSAQNDALWRKKYRETQRQTIIQAVRQYNADLTIVQNVDFGHTDPQIVLPIGRTATLDPAKNQITLEYS